MSDIRLESFVRGLVADTALAAEQFAVGQRWTGRVIQALADERFVVMLGELRVLAQSTLPLAPGQRIVVEVMSAGGDPIELRLRSATPGPGVEDGAVLDDMPLSTPRADAAPRRSAEAETPASPEIDARKYRLAAVARGLAAASQDSGTTPETSSSAAALLRQSALALLPPADAAALQQLLQPLALGSPAVAVAAALREWLANGGFFFETHLAALLAATPPATGEQALDALRADLKTLLGRMALRCARRVVADSRGGEPDDSGDTATLQLRAAGASRDAVADRLLAEQVEVAHQWLAEGALAFEVPVSLPRGEARALVHVRREGERESSGGADDDRSGAGWSVSVHVESEDFGRVHAAARWRLRECEAIFYVDRGPTHDALAARLDSLQDGLGAIFDRVTLGVRVDEVLARRPATAIRPPHAPGGGIVNVRI